MNPIRRSLLWPLLLAATMICSLAAAQSDDAEAVRTQALKLFHIFKSRDWKALYGMTAFSPALAKQMPNREAFAIDFDKGLHDNDPDNSFGKLADGMTDMVVGIGIVDKSSSLVATSCKVTLGSEKPVTFIGIGKFIKVDGVWKWDLTFTDDPQKATEQRFIELFGSPVRG